MSGSRMPEVPKGFERDEDTGPPTPRKVREMYSRGLSIDLIARQLGKTREEIGEMLRLSLEAGQWDDGVCSRGPAPTKATPTLQEVVGRARAELRKEEELMGETRP